MSILASPLLFFLLISCRGGPVQSLQDAATYTCKDFPPLVSVNTTREKAPSVSDPPSHWSEHQKKIWDALAIGSEYVFDAYRKGEWTEGHSKLLDSCVSTIPEASSFQYALQSVFFSRTMQIFQATDKTNLIRFREDLLELSHSFFRLLAHYREPDLPDKPGGFHRGTRSIFLDFGKIAPDEWPIIFIHEASHALDDILPVAVATYANDKLVKSIADRIHKAPNEIPEDLRQDIQRWITAGLDRGFLGECRAWAATLGLYQSGRDDGLWKSITWVESVLKTRLPGEPLTHLVVRNLDPNFTDPTEGIFAVPLIAQELFFIRSQIRSHGIALKLGRLEAYL